VVGARGSTCLQVNACFVHEGDVRAAGPGFVGVDVGTFRSKRARPRARRPLSRPCRRARSTRYRSPSTSPLGPACRRYGRARPAHGRRGRPTDGPQRRIATLRVPVTTATACQRCRRRQVLAPRWGTPDIPLCLPFGCQPSVTGPEGRWSVDAVRLQAAPDDRPPRHASRAVAPRGRAPPRHRDDHAATMTTTTARVVRLPSIW